MSSQGVYFYSSISVHFNGLAGPASVLQVPWAENFDAFSSGIPLGVVRGNLNSDTPAGLYVLTPAADGTVKWRFALGLADLSASVATGSVVSVFLNVTSTQTFASGVSVWKNGSNQTSLTVAPDASNSVWVTLAATASSSAVPTFLFPGNQAPFTSAIYGLPLTVDYNFGTSATAPTPGVSVAIQSLTELGTYFNPVEGNSYGGTGTTTINNEPQRYRPAFDGNNHSIGASGLTLTATNPSGTWNTYGRAQILTTGAGINVNAIGGTVPTTFAALSLAGTEPWLSTIELGDCVTYNSGMIFVTGVDLVGQTITFEAVSNGGAVSAYKGNWAVTFTKLAFCPLSANMAQGATSATFQRAVPSSVVVGSMLGGGQRAFTYYAAPTSYAACRVQTISTDRKTITFDSPANLSGTGVTLLAASDGIWFIPETWSGQIWSKRAFGPNQVGSNVCAIEVTFKTGVIPWWLGGANYTKAQIDAFFAANPTIPMGFWPAIWLYQFKPNGTVAGARFDQSEVDMMELFSTLYRGAGTFTATLHGAPYTVTPSLSNAGGLNSNYPGATWETSAAGTTNMSANASSLDLASNAYVTDGNFHTLGLVWTKAKAAIYLDNYCIYAADYSVSSDYPMQLGIDLAMGALNGSSAAALAFPQNSANFSGCSLTVSRIQAWEI